MVTAAHCAVGIPAVAVSLFPSAQCHNKTLTKPGPMSHIRPLVDAGFVPIIHGDVVLDTDKKCCVYSGDSILKWYVMYCNCFQFVYIISSQGGERSV